MLGCTVQTYHLRHIFNGFNFKLDFEFLVACSHCGVFKYLIAWQWRCGCLETDRLSEGDEIKISDRNSQWVVNIPRINRIFGVCTGVLKFRISEKLRRLKHPVISSNTRQYAWFHHAHYTDVIMTTMASQITSLRVVYSIVHSGADQRKHQSSASLAYVWGIHRDRWIPRTKGQ